MTLEIIKHRITSSCISREQFGVIEKTKTKFYYKEEEAAYFPLACFDLLHQIAEQPPDHDQIDQQPTFQTLPSLIKLIRH